MNRNAVLAGCARLVCLIFVFFPARLVLGTVLDDYVAAPEPNYTYSMVNTIPGSGYTGYVLDMISQDWRSITEVDRTLWQHWLTVIVPDTVSSDTAFLFIDGGDNGGPAPDSVDSDLALAAVSTQTVVAHLEMVPNQPLYFTDESQPRHEDAIIAYSWDKYLTSGDPNWLAQLPMTKSAVRAMDTVQDFCANLGQEAITIDDFVVSGASKRGWTAWLTAAVDSQVAAVMPIVIDMLNMEKSFRHHHAAYGYWAPAVNDYEEMGIFEWFGTPEIESLMEIVDPYEYRNRLTMPKFMINSTGDQFFLPDSAQFYFQDLPQEKYLRYIPNTDHSLDWSAYFSMLVFYQSVLDSLTHPQFSWIVQEDGSIVVQTIDAPTQVNLWQATNYTTRDFRLETIGAVWTSSPLSDQGGGVYIAHLPEPPSGWTAFFVELIYDSGLTTPYKFTTEVSVVPYYLPFICDFDFDGDIGLADLAVFVEQWLEAGELFADVVPKGGDATVNFLDFTTFGRNWRPGN
jgi:PhoPQ-activated pathogenicity-related protein